MVLKSCPAVADAVFEFLHSILYFAPRFPKPRAEKKLAGAGSFHEGLMEPGYARDRTERPRPIIGRNNNNRLARPKRFHRGRVTRRAWAAGFQESAAALRSARHRIGKSGS